MTAPVSSMARFTPPLRPSRRFLRLAERNAWSYRRAWYVFVAGLTEPIFYLFSIGIGVGALVTTVESNGMVIDYDVFVAPGLLASAAMNGSVFDTTFNFFIKLKYFKLYDAVLATPLEPRDVALGEVAWALTRGSLYSLAFIVAMVALGLAPSGWVVLTFPVAILIGASFAAVGLAAATFLRSYTDFDLINLVLTPLFLFSATFFPLSQYPSGVAAIVEWTPLYQGVELCRALSLGAPHWGLLANVAYLVLMGVAGAWIAARRIDTLLRS